MPRKGTHKKNPTGRTKPVVSLTPSTEALALLDKVAVELQFKNPRTGRLNRSQALEYLAQIYRAFSRTYPDNIPFPQALSFYFQQRAALGDEEAAQHLEWLESWGIEQDMREAIEEGVIKVGDSWIV